MWGMRDQNTRKALAAAIAVVVAMLVTLLGGTAETQVQRAVASSTLSSVYTPAGLDPNAPGTESDQPIDCSVPAGYTVMSTGHIVEGDIIVGKLDELEADCAAGRPWRGAGRGETRGHGVVPGFNVWPNGRVPYLIDSTLPDHARITAAIQQWEAATTLEFDLKTSNDADYVYFTNGDHCASEVGRQGGRQDIVLSSGKEPNEIVGSSISRVSDVYTWFADGMVSAGSATDLDSKRIQYAYQPASGYTISQIRGIAIAKATGWVYVWYSNGRVSAGTSSDFDVYRTPSSFTLPPGKSVSNIAEMDIGPDGKVYTWYYDNTYSIGTSTDLDAYQGLTPYTTAAGLTALHSVGIAIGPTGDVFAWYTNGEASAGTSADFDVYRNRFDFNTPKECSISSIVHEIGHTIGLKHEHQRCDRDIYVRVFEANMDPVFAGNFDRMCGMAGLQSIGAYNPTSRMHYANYTHSINGGPTMLRQVPDGASVSASDVIDMSIAGSSDVYTWWTDGYVTSGTSDDLELHRARYEFTLPSGYSNTDIVGIGIAKVNGNTYTFYRDGKRSIGSTSSLDSISGPVTYTLPPGYAPSDIIAIDIAPNGRVYTYYDNGRVSTGTSTDLDAYTPPTAFTLAPGRAVGDVLGVGIAPSGSVYAWYTDGDVSAGTSTDLDADRALYDFSSRLDELAPSDVLNAGDLSAINTLY